jgi:hypothetical protein
MPKGSSRIGDSKAIHAINVSDTETMSKVSASISTGSPSHGGPPANPQARMNTSGPTGAHANRRFRYHLLSRTASSDWESGVFEEHPQSVASGLSGVDIGYGSFTTCANQDRTVNSRPIAAMQLESSFTPISLGFLMPLASFSAG